MSKFFYSLIFLLILSTRFSYSQEFVIREVKLVKNDLEIHYDLVDERRERSYSIQLYTSLDNYIQPVKKVEGDVGIDISVGGNKKLIWHAKEELGPAFDGSLSLELKGNIYIPFVQLEGLEDGMVYKRAKPFDLIWSGGRGDNVLNFELYQGENVIYSFEERPNVGNTTMVIPSGIKPGKGYRFRISDVRNKDEIVFTNYFEVKRKIPLTIKIGAGVLVGGIIGYIIGNQPEVIPDIEVPPLPERP